MDFIERLIGVSPDGGNGTTELMFLAALLLIVGVVKFKREFRKGIGALKYRAKD